MTEQQLPKHNGPLNPWASRAFLKHTYLKLAKRYYLNPHWADEHDWEEELGEEYFQDLLAEYQALASRTYNQHYAQGNEHWPDFPESPVPDDATGSVIKMLIIWAFILFICFAGLCGLSLYTRYNAAVNGSTHHARNALHYADQALRLLNDPKKALQFANRVLEKEASHPRANLYAGRAYEAQKQWQQAYACYLAGATDDWVSLKAPERVLRMECKLQLAQLYLNTEQHQEAIQHYHDVLSLYHVDTTALIGIVTALQRSGRYEKALPFLEKAATYFDHLPEVNYLLAQHYALYAQDSLQACRYMRRAARKGHAAAKKATGQYCLTSP